MNITVRQTGIFRKGSKQYIISNCRTRSETLEANFLLSSLFNGIPIVENRERRLLLNDETKPYISFKSTTHFLKFKIIPFIKLHGQFNSGEIVHIYEMNFIFINNRQRFMPLHWFIGAWPWKTPPSRGVSIK